MRSSSCFISQSLPSKVKNILTRHSCPKKVKLGSSHQPQEGSYLLKYAPKYYQSLTIQLKTQNALLSKVKKIKKLKIFTGVYKDKTFQKLGLSLLANTRKDIEEIPQIEPNESSIMIRKSFSIKTNTQKMKYFPNVTKLARPRWDQNYLIGSFSNILTKKRHFVMYLENLRRLKSLQILINHENLYKAKWLLEKLAKMSRLLGGLETFTIEIRTQDPNSIHDLLQYKDVFCHVTGLVFPQEFRWILAEIPRRCKKLKSLSINLEDSKDDKLEVFTLLNSIQKLACMKSLSFSWPEDTKLFWDNFKPPSSLRYLSLKFYTYDLLNKESSRDVVHHWQEIKELDVLEFEILCGREKETIFARFLITKILQKIRRLGSLKISLKAPVNKVCFLECCEPFFVEEVPHLYESLRKFEFSLGNISKENDNVKIDLKTTKLRLFKNFKEVKIDGERVGFERMDKIVDLLQENQKEGGEYSMLEFHVKKKEELKEALQKIKRIKRNERNFKINIHFHCKDDRPNTILARYNSFALRNFEELCKDIKIIGSIKGLAIYLDLEDEKFLGLFPVKEMRKILTKYVGVRNLTARLHFFTGSLEYINLEGENPQLFVDDRLRR